MAPINGDSTTEAVAGVLGTNSAAGTGVVGQSNDGRGMSGWSVTNYGVVTGDSNKFPGVRGTSVSGRGVEGWSTSAEGVWGISTTGDGVFGTGHRGVVPESALTSSASMAKAPIPITRGSHGSQRCGLGCHW